MRSPDPRIGRGRGRATREPSGRHNVQPLDGAILRSRSRWPTRKRIRSGRARAVALPLLALALLAGCSDAGRSPGTAGPAEPASGTVPLPADSPYIRGIVTAVDSASVRIEADPTSDSGSPKAIARITPSTAVLFRSGEAVGAEELTVGHLVSVWLTGPIMESYPEQGTASAIVIEPLGAVAPPSP